MGWLLFWFVVLTAGAFVVLAVWALLSVSSDEGAAEEAAWDREHARPRPHSRDVWADDDEA